MKENQSIALSIFLTAGSAVLILYATLWYRGIFGKMWKDRFKGKSNRIGAWITSALIATFSVIGTSAIMIAEEQSSSVLFSFGGFLISAIGWPIACLHANSQYPPGEQAAVMLTGLASIWLCVEATNNGSSVYLIPLTASCMLHHLMVDGLWWPSTK